MLVKYCINIELDCVQFVRFFKFDNLYIMDFDIVFRKRGLLIGNL